MTLAWVTGGAGFIGRHLVQHLVSGRARVAGLDLAGPGGLSDAVVGWQTGRLSAEGMTALANQVGSPDIIYHLAGGASVGASLNDPAGDFHASVVGTAILLDWLRECSDGYKLSRTTYVTACMIVTCLTRIAHTRA